ncbi:alpha-N-acetylglucosaminidase [Streptomyces oceani]|uniref:Alpha-N-acetylglucosaminidase n=1 Tax=Streptomyces oceani TaxID=1075402 RepID=A0A1E7KLU6_9ACTN|nr:alpha-N-acetylglucosaminidase [Streptomyces oceani]OEV04858.1 alpha-N-acetylglucosaminidase [Streptomyces oceani]
MPLSRRTLLGSLALTASGGAVVAASGVARAGGEGAAGRALARLLPRHTDQVTFRNVERRRGDPDFFRVHGDEGALLVEGTTPAVQLTGLHWYLRSTARASFSWTGAQNRLPGRLPAPAAPVERTANVRHRFVLNDTNEGYTGPHRTWDQWEHTLDVLALHGYNEVFLSLGADAVYHRVFQDFGYTDAEVRDWIPGPAHQPWWLLQNMSSFGGPVTRQLLDARAALARRVVDRAHALGMTPVLPGYFGTVPPGFADRNPGARTVPQGEWVGFRRPDWLDPRGEVFARVAARFYAVQHELLGTSDMYKMDLLHEGGQPGDVPVGEAARAVETALRTARPDAVWAMLGWQNNPRTDILDAVDRNRVFIVDGLSDRFPDVTDREADWGGTPYAFGSIWNFGGHTAMGANTPDWAELYEKWRTRSGSALDGIALMPEGADNNPAALALFSDLAWSDGRVDLAEWFAEWPAYRYGTGPSGRPDPRAVTAWDVLRRTAYGTTRSDSWSEPHDGLFGARPSLTAKSAASWSPERLRHDPEEFARALPALLAVAPALRSGSGYRYDLLDVTRQVLSHRSRQLLPRIRAAYGEKDQARFAELTDEWFRWMELLEKAVATDPGHLLGRWTAEARAWGATREERDRLAYDAESLLTVWGPRKAADEGGLRDYANREWSGLLSGLYALRWRTYFDELSAALAENREPEPVDWYALEEEWLRGHPPYATEPTGDIVRVARQVRDALGPRAPDPDRE